MSRRDLYRSSGPSRLHAVEFDVTLAVAADAANYWTLQMYVARSGQSVGERVGSAFSFAARSLGAGNRIRLLDDAAGVELEDGDVLAMTGIETGSPAAIEGLMAWLDIQRVSR